MKSELEMIKAKLKIVRELAQSNETQQVCALVIDLINALDEKEPLGFTSSESKRLNKSKK